jgi:hypothetical protein
MVLDKERAAPWRYATAQTLQTEQWTKSTQPAPAHPHQVWNRGTWPNTESAPNNTCSIQASGFDKTLEHSAHKKHLYSIIPSLAACRSRILLPVKGEGAKDLILRAFSVQGQILYCSRCAHLETSRYVVAILWQPLGGGTSIMSRENTVLQPMHPPNGKQVR